MIEKNHSIWNKTLLQFKNSTNLQFIRWNDTAIFTRQNNYLVIVQKLMIDFHGLSFFSIDLYGISRL